MSGTWEGPIPTRDRRWFKPEEAPTKTDDLIERVLRSQAHARATRLMYLSAVRLRKLKELEQEMREIEMR